VVQRILISESRPSVGARLAVAGGLLVGLLVLVFVVLPLAVAALIALVVVVLVVRLRRWCRSLRDPNGPMDGRENVRVVVRDGE